MLPTDSPGAPTARSAKPSLSKSPAVNASPKPSNSSAMLPTPGLSWVKSWLPDPVSPAAPPYSTFTAPAPVILPTDSPGTPTARSADPSLLKSARRLPAAASAAIPESARALAPGDMPTARTMTKATPNRRISHDLPVEWGKRTRPDRPITKPRTAPGEEHHPEKDSGTSTRLHQPSEGSGLQRVISMAPRVRCGQSTIHDRAGHPARPGPSLCRGSSRGAGSANVRRSRDDGIATAGTPAAIRPPSWPRGSTPFAWSTGYHPRPQSEH
jgi:hypothetical protein